ncbi:N-acetylneuraminate synthase family protein [Mesorhizobium sp. AaZ16]|uniref:N-acetylneuraminate synthase family protein n=1 Tax=Mesorhizobium sp. AaZ16 TaxID=3402289 RepID=UPI00374E95B2
MNSGRCFVIAEVAQAHDGSLGQAHAFIDAVARTGASAVKFQTHIADCESSPDEPFRVRFSLQDKSRYDYWKRIEFSPEEWAGLKIHAEERGLVFMSSPFSIEAVNLLLKLNVVAWKVGSGELESIEMLEAMASSRRPIYLSTGMNSYPELDGLVTWLRERHAAFTLMQCTTQYPSSLAQVGLNVIAEYRRRYNCPVGLSDHSASIFPSLAAVTLGASALEVHVVLSREMFGPDTKASVTIDELKTLVDGVREIETMLDKPVDKDALAKELAPLKTMFGKSAYSRTQLTAGYRLRRDDVVMLKPGGGIAERHIGEWIGRPLARAVPSRHRLSCEDFAE